MEEEIRFENIGAAMTRIRKSQPQKWTQADVAAKLHMERSVYAKYENNALTPSSDRVKDFAALFHIKTEELTRKVSYAIPDTSALLKNKQLLGLLLEDYHKVVIPDTVQKELDKAKDRGNKAGWQVQMAINDYRKKYPDKMVFMISERYKDGSSDDKIMSLARELSKKEHVDVYIIHDDIGFSNAYENSLLLRDYMATRTKSNNYATILALDEEYDRFDYYYKKAEELNLNEYLPDGLTLLISCIRHNEDVRTDKKKGDIVPESARLQKMQFLLEQKIDINKTDSSSFCFTPLTHCVQIDDFKGFSLLLEAGADFNKGSMDEANTGYFKTQNEGNTPLMVACWHGRKKYIIKLCETPGICLNQQDGNGYTALMKCAIQRYRRKQKGQDVSLSESLYNLLIEKGVDSLIRDRRNHTALDWWKRGNDFSYRGSEQW